MLETTVEITYKFDETEVNRPCTATINASFARESVIPADKPHILDFSYHSMHVKDDKAYAYTTVRAEDWDTLEKHVDSTLNRIKQECKGFNPCFSG